MQKIALFLGLLLLVACNQKAELSDAYGNFEATTTTISSEANGRLLSLRVQEGIVLGFGDWVGLVDTTHIDLQRKQLRATINTLPKKLRNTLADIDVLQKQKANLMRERDRVQRLLDKKAATPKQLDDLKGQIDVVEQQITAIRAQTNTANRAILSEKEPLLAQMAILDEQIRKSYIYNPVPGTVLTKLTEPHELVGMGTPLYRIGRLDTLTLRFYVDAVQLQSLKLGQTIQVLADRGEKEYDEYQGQISWMAAQAEFTPKTIQTKEDRINLVYAVKALVPNPEGHLKIGMPAEVNISPRQLTEAK